MNTDESPAAALPNGTAIPPAETNGHAAVAAEGVAEGAAELSKPVLVLICGGGPAGLLLAHYLLSFGRGQFRVVLHDKGEDPREVVKQGPSLKRYSIGLNERGTRSIRAVPGLFDQVKQVMVRAESVTLTFGSRVMHMKIPPTDPETYLVDRFSLCAALLAALCKAHEASGLLELHFNSAATDVNLPGKKVVFCSTKAGEGHGGVNGASISFDSNLEKASHEKDEVHYDILVGADGVRSAVRHAFLTQVRNFCYETRDIFNHWHSTHLPCPKDYPPSTLHFIPWVSKTEGVQAIGIPSPDGTLAFLWGWGPNKRPHDWFECKTKEEAAKFVNERLSFLNMDEETAWGFLNQPGHTTMQVKCWTYHDAASSAVLIGDAAHATSPAIGNGCNSSLSDVAVLARLLLGVEVNETNRIPKDSEPAPMLPEKFSRERIFKRLPAVLERYSALQVKEGLAVVDLSDAAACIEKRLQTWNSVGMIVRTFFHKLLPWLISAPVQMLVTDPTIPYHKIYQRYRSETEYANRSNASFRYQWYMDKFNEAGKTPIPLD